MASTDWTSISTGTVSFSIVADGTAPSPPDVMEISTTGAAGQAFQNITGGPFKNSRMSGWVNQAQSSGSIGFRLNLRSLNTVYESTATYFLARIAAFSSTQVRIRIDAVVAGATTVLILTDVTALNGTPISTWQQYQFSALNSGTDILLRVAQWNGAAFVPVMDVAAPIASFPTLDAAGSGRFGGDIGATGTIRIDDVAFYSLA